MKDNSEKQRLSKLMGQRGLCSRREADALIEKGLVKVNGKVESQLGIKVDPDSEIEILNSGKKDLSKKVTVALNKPRGYVSSQPEKNYPSALSLLKKANYAGEKKVFLKREGLAPLGRLDIDSTGLILYSQNGVLAKKIIGENSEVEKEYEVNITEGVLSESAIQKLTSGLELDNVKLKKAQVKKISPTFFKITLKQGRKRQIRRMCELVGLKVTRIKRIRIGKYKLENLAEGEWTFVKESEIL